jgi:hypothetical protein
VKQFHFKTCQKSLRLEKENTSPGPQPDQSLHDTVPFPEALAGTSAGACAAMSKQPFVAL